MTTGIGNASLVLRGGKVFSSVAQGGFAEAVAFDNDTIMMVGKDCEIDALIGPSTRVVNLAGRLVIPAFGDAHVHAVSGGLESLRCNLLGIRDRRGCLDKISAHVAALPADAWLLGGGWTMEMFPGGLPTVSDLDSVCGGRPAFLLSASHHSAWVNTAAMDRAGIDESMPDPFAGRIERDGKGIPTGVLHEGATSLLAGVLPRVTHTELTNGLRVALKRLHGLGITYWQDALIGNAEQVGMADSFGVYVEAMKEGWLTSRVRGALWWDHSQGIEQLETLQARREIAPDGVFRATTVKMMVDGATGTLSAAMSSPYLGDSGRREIHRGDVFIEPDQLAEAVRVLDTHGFQIHFHAIGDRAISISLDAIEKLGEERWGKNRHHIAHLRWINPRDLHRFRKLGVIANFQPLWAHFDSHMEDFIIPVLGQERAEWQYSIRSLLDRQNRVAFGSDWPVSSPDPLQGIHVAVNRMLSTKLGNPGTDETTKPLRSDQRISLESAIDAYTKGVAYINGDEELLGVLEPGRRGDVVVLSEDIFSIPVSEIGDVDVELTVAGGSIVFGNE